MKNTEHRSRIFNSLLVVLLLCLVYITSYSLVIQRRIGGYLTAYIPESLVAVVRWDKHNEKHWMLKVYRPVITLNQMLRPSDWVIKESDWEYSFY